MSEHIDHMLANYLSANVGYSEAEAVDFMKASLGRNPEFAENLRRELSIALADPLYSWRASLSKFDVLEADSEEVARGYAKRILWDQLFGT